MFENIQLGNKQIGGLLIVIGIALFFVVLSYADKMNQFHQQTCPLVPGGQCPYGEFILTMEGYAGFTIALALLVLGFYIMTRIAKEEFRAKTSKGEKENLLKDLTNKERSIYNLVVSSGGTIFQSDIVEKSGDSKVNVTRALDRLEGKGLIERKRRGMSNVIILKH